MWKKWRKILKELNILGAKPAVNTNVYEKIDWIKKIINEPESDNHQSLNSGKI